MVYSSLLYLSMKNLSERTRMMSGPGVEGVGTSYNIGGKQDCLGNASVLKGYLRGVKFLLMLLKQE